MPSAGVGKNTATLLVADWASFLLHSERGSLILSYSVLCTIILVRQAWRYYWIHVCDSSLMSHLYQTDVFLVFPWHQPMTAQRVNMLFSCRERNSIVTFMSLCVQLNISHFAKIKNGPKFIFFSCAGLSCGAGRQTSTTFVSPPSIPLSSSP